MKNFKNTQSDYQQKVEDNKVIIEFGYKKLTQVEKNFMIIGVQTLFALCFASFSFFFWWLAIVVIKELWILSILTVIYIWLTRNVSLFIHNDTKEFLKKIL